MFGSQSTALSRKFVLSTIGVGSILACIASAAQPSGAHHTTSDAPIRNGGVRQLAMEGHDMSDRHVSSLFAGVKANKGTVTHTVENGQQVLTLSDDFVVPETPAPHWQVVDSQGNIFLLQRLKIDGNKFNKRIILPSYVHDVAKVQIWCAYAEVLLGEASFAQPVH